MNSFKTFFKDWYKRYEGKATKKKFCTKCIEIASFWSISQNTATYFTASIRNLCASSHGVRTFFFTPVQSKHLNEGQHALLRARLL